MTTYCVLTLTIMTGIFAIVLMASYQSLSMFQCDRKIAWIMALCIAALSVTGFSEVISSIKESKTDMTWGANIILWPYLPFLIAIITTAAVCCIQQLLRWFKKQYLKKKYLHRKP